MTFTVVVGQSFANVNFKKNDYSIEMVSIQWDI